MAFNATYSSSDLSPILTDLMGRVGVEVGHQGGLIGVALGLGAVILTGVAIKNALF